MRQMMYLFAAIAMLLTAACSAPQKTIYFAENSPLNPHVQVENIEQRKEITILPDDILAINVSTISSITIGNRESGADPVSIF